MRRTATLLAAATVLVATSIAARQNPQQPVFRAGVELIQLDVSVLDKDRHPIRGLTASDFSVMVDGQPRPVVAFKAVELPPPPPPPPAAWMREVAPDVVTNTRPSGRVVVIVIDDGSFQQADPESAGAGFSTPVTDPRAIDKAREVARTTVRELGPDDMAAVVFTENNHTAQGFTRDRARLFAAIDSAALFASPSRRPARPLDMAPQDQNDLFNDPDNIMRPACLCGTCSIYAVGRIATSLATLPQQRKIVMYISAGVPLYSFVRSEGSGYLARKENCNAERKKTTDEVFRLAALSNVTVQSIDPKGLILGVVASAGGNPLDVPSTSRIEFLRAMADSTGGRAVVNNNDMEQQVPAVLAESSSYYLLGVESPGATEDGRFHPITVRVNRADLEVRTRKGYYDPTQKERQAMTARVSPDLDASVTGVLPKSDIPMEVTVAPFATADGKATLAIVLNVDQPSAEATRGQARTEQVEVLASLFDHENGRGFGEERHRLAIDWNATSAASGHYEVLSRLPVPSGRYELRLGLKTADGRTASVYSSVDVPDFESDDLSLSGLVLGAKPALRSAPAGAFSNLLPLVPTARRLFRATDEVTAFLRVYQNRQSFSAATVTTRITNTKNAIVAELAEPLTGTSVGSRSAVDFQIDLPVPDLPQGEYLLTIEVRARERSAKRDLRFRVE